MRFLYNEWTILQLEAVMAAGNLASEKLTKYHTPEKGGCK